MHQQVQIQPSYLARECYSHPLRFLDGDGYIHGFTTGYVRVKKTFEEAVGGPMWSKIRFLSEKTFTDWLPIWVWVIDHPEGIFVVDTGENTQVSEAGYFDAAGPFLRYVNTHAFGFSVSEEQEVAAQLHRLGYQMNDIHRLVLTHLHLDHIDGLSAFEDVRIVLHKEEWENPFGLLPYLLPQWFDPELVTLSSEANPYFLGQMALSRSGEIQLVATPGHTPGHCAVLVKTPERDYLLAGDCTYNQAQLKELKMSGAHASFSLARRTLKGILDYANMRPLVYLPSHDREALERLAGDSILV